MALGNKETMARNIKRYMAKYNKSSKDIYEALGIKQNTFSDWINAKAYPRIDKIEMLANYFGCSKSDLVEDSNQKNFVLSEMEKNLIIAFRQADEIDRRSILRTLGLEKNISSESSDKKNA